jgi:ribosomal protein S27AE
MKTSSNILAEIKLAYQKQQLNGLELEIKVIEYAEMHRKEQLILSGVVVPKGTLNCPECGKHTQIVSHNEKKASCFYCGKKWEI